MNTELISWESWLVHHPRAARKLMDELPVPCKMLTPVGETVNLAASAFIGNAYVMGRLADTLVTREFAERILRDLGYELEDRIKLKGSYLALISNCLCVMNFSGTSRWKNALRWALERWEKVPHGA